MSISKSVRYQFSLGKKKFIFIFILMLIVLLCTVYWFYLDTEYTDNAQIEAHIVSLSARLPGQIVSVLVRDNQQVNVGDVLVELDKKDASIKLELARADLNSAQAQYKIAQEQLKCLKKTLKANFKQAWGGYRHSKIQAQIVNQTTAQMQAEQNAALSRLQLVESEFTRAKNLYDNHVISQSEYEHKQSQHTQALANYESSSSKLSQAKIGIEQAKSDVLASHGRLLAADTIQEQTHVAEEQVVLANTRVLQAESALRQSELNLSYLTIRAPISGVVSKRWVEVGQMVSSDRPLLMITSLEDVWVVANFKETQIKNIHPGQLAWVDVDASLMRIEGAVESISGASGARFSLFPPDNASGNFTKVVQRIPVIIRLHANQHVPILRPGMSVLVRVQTKKSQLL